MAKEFEPPHIKTPISQGSKDRFPTTIMETDTAPEAESATTLYVPGYQDIQIKPYYETSDAAFLMQKSQHAARHLIRKAKRATGIVGIKMGMLTVYPKEDFLNIMAQISKPREETQVKQSKRYLPSDHKDEVLSALKAAGEKGLSSDDLIKPHIESGVARRTATSRIRRIIHLLRKDGESIVNLTPLKNSRSGEKPVYVIKDTKKDHAPKSQQAKAKEKRNPNPIQSEILDKTVAYLLYKHVQGHPEEINRSVRVNLGRFLAPKTTLPDIFGNGPLQITDDSELKNLVIEHLANKLETYWNPESGITNISEVDEQIIESCIVLKRWERKREDIIQDIDRRLPIR